MLREVAGIVPQPCSSCCSSDYCATVRPRAAYRSGHVATIGAVAASCCSSSVNLISFKHSSEVDCTRDQRFTLPPELAAEFGKLRPTNRPRCVVHQTLNFGPLMATRDSFTKATEAEVTAKVLDLVDLFASSARSSKWSCWIRRRSSIASSWKN